MKWIATVAALLGVSLLGASCGPARTLDPDATEPVRIGVVLSLMGDLGGPGQRRLEAVRLAAREVNAGGGVIGGRRVELVIGDGESDPGRAVEVAEEIVEGGVAALIGESGSASTLAIYMDVTQPAGVIHASGSSTSTAISDFQADLLPDERWFFRTAPSDAAQAPVLGNEMYLRGCRRLVIAHLTNDYGMPFADAVEATFTDAGGTVVTRVPMADGLASYAAEAMQIATADTPDCVALIAYPGSGGRLMADWSLIATRPMVRFFGTDALRQASFVAEAGGAVNVDGFLGTAPLTEAPRPPFNIFAAAYEGTWSRPPSTYDSSFYDAAALILLAIAKSESTEPAEILAAVRSFSDPSGTIVRAGELAEGLRLIREGRAINYDGASGPVDVDESGEVRGIYEVWEYDATSMTFARNGDVIVP